MKLSAEMHDNGIAILYLKGEFDTYHVSMFTAKAAELLASGYLRLVLNLRWLRFLNSTALGAIIKTRKQFRADGGDVVISSPSPFVRETMESLGLDRVFTIVNHDSEALTYLKGDRLDLEGLNVDSPSAVRIHFHGAVTPTIGRLVAMQSSRLTCSVPASTPEMVGGRSADLVFRLPLYRRQEFKVRGTLLEMEADGPRRRLTFEIAFMTEQDRVAVATFVEDMQQLQRAVHENSFESGTDEGGVATATAVTHANLWFDEDVPTRSRRDLMKNIVERCRAHGIEIHRGIKIRRDSGSEL